MTLDNLANQSIKNIELPNGYCRKECPQDEKMIADIWYDVGQTVFHCICLKDLPI